MFFSISVRGGRKEENVVIVFMCSLFPFKESMKSREMFQWRCRFAFMAFSLSKIIATSISATQFCNFLQRAMVSTTPVFGDVSDNDGAINVSADH